MKGCKKEKNAGRQSNSCTADRDTGGDRVRAAPTPRRLDTCDMTRRGMKSGSAALGRRRQRFVGRGVCQKTTRARRTPRSGLRWLVQGVLATVVIAVGWSGTGAALQRHWRPAALAVCVYTFWVGVVTEFLSAVASGVGPGPYLSSVSTASHFLAGCAQDRSWLMQRSRMAV